MDRSNSAEKLHAALRPDCKGFTLVEMVVLIVLAGILITVAFRSAVTVSETVKVEETKQELDALAHAIVGNPELENNGVRADFGYVGDVGALPPDLDALVQNPGGYGTWNGPYIRRRFTQITDDYKKDAWGNLYQYSGGVTITSTGGSGIVRKLANSTADLLQNRVNGVVYDLDGTPPGSIYRDSVMVRLTVPDGVGGMMTKNTTVDAGGYFSFDSIPIGNHDIKIVYTPGNDTLDRFVSVIPQSSLYASYHLDSNYWSADTGGTSGTVTYEEFTEAKASSNVNLITIATPGGTSQGDLLIATVVTDGNTSGTIAPPGGEGWTEIDISQQTGAVTLGVWWKLADASESPSHQFTWSGGGQETYAWMMRFTGHDPTSPINASAINGSSSSTPTCPSVTTTVANTMIVRIGGFDDDDISVDNTGLSGHTDITMDESGSGSGTCSGGAGYVQQAAVGASGTADFSLTASEQWRTVTIAIAPAP